MDLVVPDSKCRKTRTFPVIAHWTSDDVNKRAEHERKGNWFRSGIIHEQPIAPTPIPKPIPEQQQTVKELDLAERFQDIMINEMGPVILKLGTLFEEAKSAGISSQSELARLFFNNTKRINNMVVDTAKEPENVDGKQRNEGQQQPAEHDKDASKSSKPVNKQQEKGDDDVISSQPNWSLGLTQMKIEGLTAVEKENLDSVLQGATSIFSTPKKVIDSIGDNPNQQSVREEKIKEYIDSQTLFEMPGEDKEPRIEYIFVPRHNIKSMIPRVQISNEVVDAWADHMNHLAARARTKYPNIYFSSMILQQMPTDINKMPLETCYVNAIYRIGYELRCQKINNKKFDNANQRQKDTHKNKLDQLRIKYLAELLTSGVNTKSMTITEGIKELHAARNT
ncbi:OLC1v1008619C1 [Oldenlandia corymbosa var. corymbosa]|uniref:OLC1v1008619C1 n=1 Tax=Oldenlandia corymbosa var. corymbosa TaxID=529605 RepID=A0AAV1DQD8_OLDCO|nr:OLC1v1008619C1 [Oldenlandia corymbosa var. corymbosa]